ncbi:hypothetical protein AERO8C_70184 [Aeromonas veronii]|uniref:Uncharacterized protein n=1 Tax=Aeromonas veronii TaxID=654 RepID=A0A653LAV5_AERVE|nr:hypothetical protein AERO8C_70184 [Aeromonas veronii]
MAISAARPRLDGLSDARTHAQSRVRDYLYAARNYLPGGQQTAEPREQSNACPDAP